MKIIFTQDVKGVGKRYDIKDMPDGYAQNFLIPRGFAVLATPKELERVKKVTDTIRVEKEVQDDLLVKNLKQVSDVVLTIKAKANEAGLLFSSIHPKDIALYMHKEKHIELDPETIVLPKPIKELGEHMITVAVRKQKATFQLIIEKEA